MTFCIEYNELLIVNGVDREWVFSFKTHFFQIILVHL